MKKRQCFAILLLIISFPFSYAHSNNVTLMIQDIYAYHFDGSFAPENNAECEETYLTLLGQRVAVNYRVDSKTLAAEAEYKGHRIRLYPEGLSGEYAFISDGVPSDMKQMRQMVFEINLSLEKSSSQAFLMYRSALQNSNCIAYAR